MHQRWLFQFVFHLATSHLNVFQVNFLHVNVSYTDHQWQAYGFTDGLLHSFSTKILLYRETLSEDFWTTVTTKQLGPLQRSSSMHTSCIQQHGLSLSFS